MSTEIEALQQAVVDLTESLNACMAQQTALQHALYAVLDTVADPDAVAEALTDIANNFMEAAEEDQGLGEEVLAIYEDEIDEMIATLEERIPEE